MLMMEFFSKDYEFNEYCIDRNIFFKYEGEHFLEDDVCNLLLYLFNVVAHIVKIIVMVFIGSGKDSR